MKNLILLGLLIGAITMNAQDRLFTYTYQSNVLNKGQKELEVWTTMSNGHENYYRAFDHRLEFEIGLGSKLQTAFYLNYGYSKGIESNNNVESVVADAGYSFSNEWKLKLSDPVVNPIGTALYFEYTLGTDEIELESKLIFDKQIGKTLQALNIVGEYEFINEFENNADEVEIIKEKEITLELNYAFAYKLNNNFSLGLEVFNKNRYEENEWKFNLLSAGPCFSYSVEGFWVNLTFMPQIIDFKTGNQELTDNEKIQTRLAFSYEF